MKVKVLTRDLLLETEEVLGRVAVVVGIINPTLKMKFLCNKMFTRLMIRGLLLETEEVLDKVVVVAGITNQKIILLNKFKLTMGH
jgi:hypothetical protein